ncbi:hypothetical protein [Bradyrhizobium guangzhouense]|uniref:hypothetical protein n=1 Tax=Bradyrhizobium guangzhouense TaxID=1325095 RepID=UPI00100932AF|nr:hypothetical protein [Bradyrhizobium guangzhouense]
MTQTIMTVHAIATTTIAVDRGDREDDVTPQTLRPLSEIAERGLGLCEVDASTLAQILPNATVALS